MMGFRAGLKGILQRFTRSQKGNVAMMAGVALPVLLMISAGAIDLHNAAKVQSELQDALDAATLAAARSSSVVPSEIQAIGMASMRANMPGYYLPDSDKDVAIFTLDEKDKVVSTATVQVKTIVANVFLPPYGKIFDDYLPMKAGSEVRRASRNVEVVMALDITYSMQLSRSMDALKSAARELVNIVVQDDQTVYKSRVALVPYGSSVNMGQYATAVRGPLTGPVNISSVKWGGAQQSATASVSRSGSTYTATLTKSNHGLVTGDYVVTSYTSSRTTYIDLARVNKIDNDKFSVVQSRASTSVSNYKYIKCDRTDCSALVETASNHGLSDGDTVKITGHSTSLGNTSGVTGRLGTVQYIDARKFYLQFPGPRGTAGSSTGGSMQCGGDGCERRVYEHLTNGNLLDAASTTCVTQRPWKNGAPSDVAPGAGNYVGRAYPAGVSNYRCSSPQVVPLTYNRTTLTNVINGMSADGITAGQIGVEMAWYMLSPNFGSIFTPTMLPEPYDTTKTIKAAILMTDGEFNTPYCNGVAIQTNPRDSTADGVLGNYYIKCPKPTNASLFEDTVEICRAMKAQGIVVYTVGFALETSTVSGPIDTAYEAMRACATNPDDNFFAAASQTDLTEAFKSIGRDITRLRIAR